MSEQVRAVSTVRRRRILQAGVVAVGAGAAYAAGASVGTSRPSAYVPSRRHDQAPGAGLPGHRSPVLKPFVDQLPIMASRSLGGSIDIGQHLHKFHRDLPAAASWGYGGHSHLGPTFEVQRGADVPTEFVNRLPRHLFAANLDLTVHGASQVDKASPATSVHLHGAPNRPEHDGHPMAAFRRGGRHTYRFGNDIEACGLWYHDHVMGTNRFSLYGGLAGQYLVRDSVDTGRKDNPLGLPAGNYEVPLMISDKLFHSDGRLRYDFTPALPADAWQFTMTGDVIVVNGKVWPNLAVDRGVYRFRVVNASLSNDFRLGLSNSMPYWVIGGDRGLLNRPVLVREVVISPGERYDVLIDFGRCRPGEHVVLKNTMPIPNIAATFGGTMVENVMRFSVGHREAPVRSVPKRLRGSGVSELPEVSQLGARRRVAKLGTSTHTPSLPIKFPASVAMFSLNNLTFDDPDFDKPVQGTVEQWDIVNSDSANFAHNFHVHLAEFRVIGRQDIDVNKYNGAHPTPALGIRHAPSADRFTTTALEKPAPYEVGWKDTVRCPPGTVTRILVKWPTKGQLGFDPDAPFRTPSGKSERGYVFHCHLTEHEDHEMMLRLRVPATAAEAGAGGSRPPTHH